MVVAFTAYLVGKTSGRARDQSVSINSQSPLEAELKLSEVMVREIKRILSELKFSDEEWSTVVIGFISQSIEHHDALLLLVRSQLFGSAFALVRSIVEILVRGVWIQGTAWSKAKVMNYLHAEFDLLHKRTVFLQVRVRLKTVFHQFEYTRE